MKVEIRTLELLYALNKVEKGLLKNHEVLSGIKLSAIGGAVLLLEATNNNIYIYTQIEGNLKIEEQGEILLSGKHFTSIIKKLSGGLVIIETKNNDAIIKSSSSRFKLRLLDVERFPERREREYSKAIKLKTDLFKKLVGKTIHATSDKRPIFQGVNFKTKDNRLIACATDSFRIARCEVDINLGEDLDVIIPAQSLQDLIKIIDSEEIEIKLNKTHAKFVFGMTSFETRLIEGSYPDLESFFVESSPIQVTFKTKQLIKAVERATIMLDDISTNAIKLKLFKNKVFISTKENELGQATEELDVKNATGEIELALSAEFLLDALKTIDEEETMFYLVEPLKPLQIAPVNGLYQKHIVLPVRVV